jgi:uncharacterized membrane protein YqjE
LATTNSHDDLQDRSVSDLTKQLSEDVTTLVRKEVELAKAEVNEKLSVLATGAGLFAAAALFAVIAVGTLTATVILVLALVMPAWLAALIVTIVVAAIAGGLAYGGKRVLQRSQVPLPVETVESVKEDIAWVKTQAMSGATQEPPAPS